METLQILWVEAEPEAEAMPFWVRQICQINCPALEVSTASSLPAASAIGEQTDRPSCIVWSGSHKPSYTDLEDFCRSQPFPIAPIVLISDGAIHVDERMRACGVRDVLYRPTLTLALLMQSIRYAVQLHQSEQQVHSANWRLRQHGQVLVRQSQLLTKQSQQIQNLNTQLAEATQLKGQFLAMISHELRTPLNAIIGFSQLLCRTSDSFNARQRDMVQRISTNANRLLELVEDILTFTKIEAGQLALQPQLVDLERLLRATLDEVRPAAVQKGLSLYLQMTDPLQVTTDPIYLQQIMANLLSNAVKFTTVGAVTVAVEQDCDRIAILVRDTGIGMRPAETRYIFEPFRQVDQSLTRQHQGAGLGLAVTASLVQQLQGTISVNSQMGQGSEFRIELPRQFAQPPASLSSNRLRNSVA